MNTQTPLETIELLDEAFNRGDLEEILDFYENSARMIIEPHEIANGKAEIRAAYEQIFANIKGTAGQEKTHVIKTGDTSPFTSKWNLSDTISNSNSASRESHTSVVLRRKSVGKWRIIVDNSWRHAI